MPDSSIMNYFYPFPNMKNCHLGVCCKRESKAMYTSHNTGKATDPV